MHPSISPEARGVGGFVLLGTAIRVSICYWMLAELLETYLQSD